MECDKGQGFLQLVLVWEVTGGKRDKDEAKSSDPEWKEVDPGHK